MALRAALLALPFDAVPPLPEELSEETETSETRQPNTSSSKSVRSKDADGVSNVDMYQGLWRRFILSFFRETCLGGLFSFSSSGSSPMSWHSFGSCQLRSQHGREFQEDSVRFTRRYA